MKTLDKYIGRVVASHTFVVLAVFLSLFIFSFFINEVDDIGNGSYTVWHAIVYVLLTIPTLAYQLFPSMALIGTIIGLGALASNSELVAIRAAGVSLNRIVVSVMKTGFILILFAGLLGEVVAPETERYAKNMRSAALTNKITLKTDHGLWARDGNHFVHIRELMADGSLNNVSIYEIDNDGRLKLITHAEKAHYRGEQWVLENIARSSINADSVTSEKLPNMNWESLLNPELVGVVSVNPDLLSAWGLFKYNAYLRDNGLETERYEQAFWKKIISPLTTGIMVFIAIPFIFGPLRSVAIGLRIVVGTLAGIGFYAFSQVFAFMGLAYQMNPFLSVIIPPALFLALAVYLTRRIH